MIIQDMMNPGAGRIAARAYRQQENFIEQIGRMQRSPVATHLRKPGLFVSDMHRSLRSPRQGNGGVFNHLNKRIENTARVFRRPRFEVRLPPSINRRFQYRVDHRFHDYGSRRLLRRFIIHELRTGKNIPPEITKLALNPLSLRRPVRFVEERLLRPQEEFRPNLVDEDIRQFLDSPFSTANDSSLRSERNDLENEVAQLRNERNDLLIDLGDLREAIGEALDELVQTRQLINSEKNFNRPVLYAIAPVGRPTPHAAVAQAASVNIQITIQQRQAGIHGSMVDVLA